jgi:hypothetical protein
VPATREQYSCAPFHPLQVGKAGGKLEGKWYLALRPPALPIAGLDSVEPTWRKIAALPRAPTGTKADMESTTREMFIVGASDVTPVGIREVSQFRLVVRTPRPLPG